MKEVPKENDSEKREIVYYQTSHQSAEHQDSMI